MSTVTISDPWAEDPEGVDGAMPAGDYVRVDIDGSTVAFVKLDAPGGPSLMVLEDQAWRLGPPVSVGFPYEIQAAGWSQADFVAAIDEARTKGVNPLGLKR